GLAGAEKAGDDGGGDLGGHWKRSPSCIRGGTESARKGHGTACTAPPSTRQRQQKGLGALMCRQVSWLAVNAAPPPSRARGRSGLWRAPTAYSCGGSHGFGP